MTPQWILLALLGAGAVFDVCPVPIESPQEQCFIAPAETAGGMDLFVLGEQAIRVYPDARSDRAFSLPLLDGTSALDIADVDNDGFGEIVSVCGDQIVRYGLFPEARRKPEPLFRLNTQLAQPHGRPFLHVMIVRRNATTVLALPCENTFELRTLNGDIVEQYPIGKNAPRHAIYGRPFVSTSVIPPQVGFDESLEYRINRLVAYEPVLPEDLDVTQEAGLTRRQGTPRQERDAARLKSESWPWFPLQIQNNSGDRVLYAIDSMGYGDTLVRIQKIADPAAPPNEKTLTKTGPERRYPGMIILTPNELPDFNGDGFADLLLWKAPEPAPTVDSLTRAMVGGVWPVRISVYLYAEAKNRFSPQAAGSFSISIPIAWFLVGTGDVPLRNVTLRDFDGDKKTDLGCSLTPQSFSVWRFSDAGFTSEPDFSVSLEEPIQSIEVRADLDGDGRTSLGLRTHSRLYFLRAATASKK